MVATAESGPEEEHLNGFDSAADFLLDMQFPNLFEPASARPDNTHFRCKGCQEVVSIGGREEHYNKHRGIRRRMETARQKRIKAERVERLAKARAVRKSA